MITCKNFTIKYPAVAQKAASNFTDFLPHPIHYCALFRPIYCCWSWRVVDQKDET